jgi:[protein-PII] uridylyltransferase
MSTVPTLSSYQAECAGIEAGFEASGDGRAMAAARAALTDALVGELYGRWISAERSGPLSFCVAALGGYGRQELFPHSDVDLLFLSLDAGVQARRQEGVAGLCRELWDLRLRLGNTSRTLAECGQFQRPNAEFTLALLDARYLAGDAELFARLRERVLLHLVRREQPELVRVLAQLTEQRREKYGGTIFHLEPNLKDAPGGLRDGHVARWLTLIASLAEHGHWAVPEELWRPEQREAAERARAFLSAARAFVHYRQGRDDNRLSYELQEQAAARGLGVEPGVALPPAAWMRHYFRHARALDRLCRRKMEEALRPRASLYGLFQDWRSRLSTPDFSVVRGRIFPRASAAGLQDPAVLLSLFEFAARHGLELSGEAERWVRQALPPLEPQLASGARLWPALRRLLKAPFAASALRDMHRLGVLDVLFPEFRAIDSFVVRDYYHRYTVDEHSFLTLEHLHRLHSSRGVPAGEGWQGKFAEILEEVEQPEILFLALLLHDVGKGLASDDHVRGSVEAVERVAERLGLEPAERATLRFLVEHHLQMSAVVMRRDIFDPETIRAFAEKTGTPERLKMLCLVTYADVCSVNPEALTPWKQEMLWQLYASTSNDLMRSLDEERLEAGEEENAQAMRLLPLVAASQEEASAFLDGFPRRYLYTHTPEEMAAHFRMAQELERFPVQLSLRDREHSCELTVIARDRPGLFASLTGALAAWGMNILKVEAFANRAGIVFDSLRFEDLHGTLALNPSERGRLLESVQGVLRGDASAESLLKGRLHSSGAGRVKVRIATQVRFETPPDSSGTRRSTLLELITQDRPGLLYQVSSALTGLGINIEVALVDTEGQKVIDVFYLTAAGAPLDAARQQAVREALLARLG